MLGALIPRLQLLTDAELQIVADGTSTERGHLMWAAACRRYDLIGEFAEEVLRERFLTLAGTSHYEDYDSFYRTKAMWHDELDEVTDLSYKKLRQVLFKMMVEAGLLTKQGHIEPPSLCPRRRVPEPAHAERHPLLPDEGGVTTMCSQDHTDAAGGAPVQGAQQ